VLFQLRVGQAFHAGMGGGPDGLPAVAGVGHGGDAGPRGEAEELLDTEMEMGRTVEVEVEVGVAIEDRTRELRIKSSSSQHYWVRERRRKKETRLYSRKSDTSTTQEGLDGGTGNCSNRPAAAFLSMAGNQQLWKREGSPWRRVPEHSPATAA